MRKSLLAIALLPLLAACSGNNKNSVNDSTPAFVREAEEQIDTLSLPTLTAEGLGPVKIGMALADLPSGVEKLYDRVTNDETPDAAVYNFMMGEEPMFTVLDFGEGKVDVISLSSPKLGVETPDGLIHLGDHMSNVLKLKGVTTEYVSLDDLGLWYWKYDGLWFNLNEGECTPELAKMLEDRRTPPKASAIPADMPVGYIGTGSPF